MNNPLNIVTASNAASEQHGDTADTVTDWRLRSSAAAATKRRCKHACPQSRRYYAQSLEAPAILNH